MSDTPMHDELVNKMSHTKFNIGVDYGLMSAFAQKLERHLIDANAKVKELEAIIESMLINHGEDIKELEAQVKELERKLSIWKP